MNSSRLLFLSFLTFSLLIPSQAFAGSNSNASAPSDQDSADTYAELEKLRSDFARLLQAGMAQAGRGLDWAQTQSGVYNPRMDLVEEKDRYFIKADLPGMDKSKLDVKVNDRSLTISGERISEKEKADQASGVYQQERTFGRFERTFPLPENVQKDKISAKYDVGVLTIELPKISPTAPAPDNSRKIQIQ